jgi:hypothetical protein
MIEINNNGIITTHYPMVALCVNFLLIAGSIKNLVTKLENVFEAKYKMKKLNFIEHLLGMGIYHGKERTTIYIANSNIFTVLCIKTFTQA